MARKILLADDSLTIQKVVELTFSDSDYELVCVSNGQKALERVADDRPDLVLADVVMPEMNGYEVCEAIKSNPATARIPVMLLSGTFEPFDRERAERIGADAIVSKPFDSQQLIAQVEALLDNAPAAGSVGPSPFGTAIEDSVAPAQPESREPEEAPFDVGFSAEDFTASVRIVPRGIDPFEEEYRRGDVDSAIETFERPPQPAAGAQGAEAAAPSEYEQPLSAAQEDVGSGPLAQWLGDETGAFEAPAGESFETEISQTAAKDEAAGLEDGQQEEEEEEEIRFEVGEDTGPIAAEPSAKAPAAETAAGEPQETAQVPHEIELLAQTSSIPELTQMLSSVAKAGGSDLTDDQIERLARRVVEKLSDRIVREIAWEVIPDMAEIVIKKRIRELEAAVE